MRAGAFKGQTVSETEDQYIDTGTLALTTKNLYFASPSKSFRLAWKKVVSFDPLEYGLGIQRDGVRAKPEQFLNTDGWFIHNLAVNLARFGEDE